ncbi:MAG: HAMP domain-containing protein, partial [Boseongicola sp.]|nr:HAMP domain-containing protein [Boseongicola sp.]
MSRYVEKKWRPPLILILGGSLMAVLIMPIYGAVFADILTPVTGRRNAVLIVATGSFIATLVLGWLLWRLILAPVQALATKAEHIRGGGAPTPLDHYGTPEIGELGQAVLDMAEVLQSREMAVRGYTDHVTHELKTPLTAIRGAAELLEADETLSDEARRMAKTIVGAEKRAERLLSAARQIAAARMPEHRGSVALDDGAGDLARRFSGIRVEVENGQQNLPLARSGLSVVLGHIAENAVEAGAKTLTLRAGQDDDGAWLTVADDGP